MKTIDPSNPALRMVAARAAAGALDLNPKARALLLEGLAHILPDDEAEQARHTAFMLREVDRLQIELFQQLTTDQP
jgi:hypothetical protein